VAFVVDKVALGAGFVVHKAALGTGLVVDTVALGTGFVVDKAALGTGFFVDKVALGTGFVVEKVALRTGFVVEKVAMGTGFLRVYQFPNVNIISHIYHTSPTLQSQQLTASLNDTTLTRNATHKLISFADFHANLCCQLNYLSASNMAPMPTVCHTYSGGSPQNDAPRMFTSSSVVQLRENRLSSKARYRLEHSAEPNSVT
jgi:hypothetical protein